MHCTAANGTGAVRFELARQNGSLPFFPGLLQQQLFLLRRLQSLRGTLFTLHRNQQRFLLLHQPVLQTTEFRLLFLLLFQCIEFALPVRQLLQKSSVAFILFLHPVQFPAPLLYCPLLSFFAFPAFFVCLLRGISGFQRQAQLSGPADIAFQLLLLLFQLLKLRLTGFHLPVQLRRFFQLLLQFTDFLLRFLYCLLRGLLRLPRSSQAFIYRLQHQRLFRQSPALPVGFQLLLLTLEILELLSCCLQRFELLLQVACFEHLLP